MVTADDHVLHFDWYRIHEHVPVCAVNLRSQSINEAMCCHRQLNLCSRRWRVLDEIMQKHQVSAWSVAGTNSTWQLCNACFGFEQSGTCSYAPAAPTRATQRTGPLNKFAWYTWSQVTTRCAHGSILDEVERSVQYLLKPGRTLSLLRITVRKSKARREDAGGSKDNPARSNSPQAPPLPAELPT